jgi:hypothetical protein
MKMVETDKEIEIHAASRSDFKKQKKLEKELAKEAEKKK